MPHVYMLGRVSRMYPAVPVRVMFTHKRNGFSSFTFAVLPSWGLRVEFAAVRPSRGGRLLYFIILFIFVNSSILKKLHFCYKKKVSLVVFSKSHYFMIFLNKFHH